jgi:hypothetical protein
LRKAVEWLGHEDASRITRDDVQGYLDHLLTVRAPKTTADVKGILNVVLGFGEERGLLEENPAAKIKVRAKAKAIDRVRPYNDERPRPSSRPPNSSPRIASFGMHQIYSEQRA